MELAQQCQLIGMRPHLDGIYEQSLQQFAALIEAEVRKQCEEKFCETHCSWSDHHAGCDQVRGDAEQAVDLAMSSGDNK